MRDLVALSTLPAIWAGADARRVPDSLANVLASTLDLDVVYVRVLDRHETLESLRTPAHLAIPHDEMLESLRRLLAAEPAPVQISEPGTGRRLRCAISRFGMGDVSGVVLAASADGAFPGEEDRVLLGVAANHACAELYRRSTERQLHAKTERFELLSSNVSDYALVITDENGVIREWGAGAERVTRYREGDVLGLPVDIIFNRADRAAGRPLAERDRADREGKASNAGWYERKGGERFYAEGVTTALRDPGGTLRGFAKIFRDATEQHEAQRALRESQQFLHAVFDSAADGICVVDAQMRCSYINPIGAAVLAYEPAELLGRPVDAILRSPLPGTDAVSDDTPIARAISTGQACRMDKDVFWRKDGRQLRVAYSVAPVILDGEQRGAVITYRDRTEAERAAQEQERLLREVQAERTRLAEVFEHSPSFMAVLTGPDHVFERANQKYIELVGRADILGKPLREVLPETMAQGFVALLDEVLGTGVPYVGTDVRIELRRPGAGVQTRYVDFVYQPMRSADGRITGVFVQGVDLTARKQSEAALAQVRAESDRRRRLYETILSNTPDLAYVFDLDHRFTYANETLLRIWGRTWDEAIGKTFLEVGYEPSHAQMHDREIEQVKATKLPVRGEVPFTGTTGRRIYEYIFVPVLGPSGDVEAVAGTTRDVTERKQAQDELETLLGRQTRRANLLGRVADAGRRMNAVRDADTIAEILTNEAREIIGAHQAVTSLTVSQDWAQAINAVSLGDKYAAYRGYDAKPDGSGIYALVCQTNRPMRMTQQELQAHPAWRGFGAHAAKHPPMRGWLAVPLVGHGGRNLGLLQLSDKHAGEFDQEDEDVLVQLAAVAAAGIENARFYNELQVQARRKDEFLAVLAHELRNPLAPLRNGLSLLELSKSAEHVERVREIMTRQVSHMARLIDDLLDVSRITTGKVQLRPETVEVRRILDAAMEVSRPAIERARHAVTLSVPESVPLLVRADPTRMAQVVSNLLNNAAKYTPEGGRIEVSAEQEGSEVVIRVRDSGAGLSAEAIPEIFELFTQVGRTLDHSQGGLGIGLALVKRLMEMHGGSVQAHSPGPGLGSTFTLRVPALAAPPEREPQIARRTPKGKRTWRILVVDDNEDAADTLAAVLTMSGHSTRVCHGGAQALGEVEAFAPEVVLLDIGLPGMDGYEVARRLRKAPHGADVLLVAITGWGTENDRKRTKEAGFDEHLTKPVEFDRLEAVLAQFEPRSSPQGQAA